MYLKNRPSAAKFGLSLTQAACPEAKAAIYLGCLLTTHAFNKLKENHVSVCVKPYRLQGDKTDFAAQLSRTVSGTVLVGKYLPMFQTGKNRRCGKTRCGEDIGAGATMLLSTKSVEILKIQKVIKANQK
jgi:hypothetical protein